MHSKFKEIISSEQITFLNKISRLLKETLQGIIGRAIVCLETGEKNYGLLLGETDWYDPLESWPELDEPYCYLMYDFIKTFQTL